jgi:methionyl-tRNA synthetase
MNKKTYITTTLPYVNADPHIGFALEIIQADALARFWRGRGEEVVFNTGTDEHGQKIYNQALASGLEPKAYCDEYAKKFDGLKTSLNLTYTNFIRTTDPAHLSAAQEFWRRCNLAGDIYKKEYETKYCVGCELEKTDSELVDGHCPVHPNLELEARREENYFFKFSKYQKPLLEFYEKNPEFVIPKSRLGEIKNFVAGGLNDFSISRLKSKMPWGVPVPGDEDQVMYVWFDALVNYISTLGWPSFAKASDGKPSEFEEYWGTKENPKAIQVAGKDNLRQQSAMWQAMLMSAGLPPSKQVFIHGFITSGGQKMSKSLGNVVNPYDLVEKYGTDAVRFFLLREIPAYEDGDFTIQKFEERFNADLANGLGNYAARVSTLANGLLLALGPNEIPDAAIGKITRTRDLVENFLAEFRFREALESIWALLSYGDERLNLVKPWSLEAEEKAEAMGEFAAILAAVGHLVSPFLPNAGEKIIKSFAVSDEGTVLSKIPPLFPRLEK